jgi:valyl-tRNA synthetase
MDKTFEPKQIEAQWRAHWETLEIGKPAPEGRPYCIMLPPPMSQEHYTWGTASNKP